LCGDGINLETLECDDGNLLNTDGCSDECEIEEGYYCEHPVGGRDACYEICGDGIMLGFFSCDDGNSIDDDGCDSDCKIEECWECDGLSPTTCYIDPVNTIGIENATMADDQSSVTIYFNNSVILQSGFDIYKGITVKVDGPLAPYNFSWYLEDANFIFEGVKTNQFKLNIDYLDS
jgi:cysteine-rich repeat protein